MSVSFSIIIPHRDCTDLLQRCLDSIPEREDVQVIVVDDNSDPSIVDFDRFPGKDRNNVKSVFTKEGKGAGYARNVGLEYATGKWIVFVDADDFFLSSFSEVLEGVTESEEDVVFYRPRLVLNDDFEMTSKRGGSEYNQYIDDYLETGNEINLRTRWHSPWSKFIKRSLIVEKNIRFEEIRYSNDVMFSALIGCEADRIAARDKSFYVVTEREGSLTSAFCRKDGELSTRTSAFFRSQKVIKSYGFPIDERLAFRYMLRLFVADRNQFKEYFKELRELSGYSRKYMIDRIFENNGFASRLKRKAYSYIITML